MIIWIKNLLKWLAIFSIATYLFSCTWLYFYQEKILFFPEKLAQDYRFQFKNKFVERDLISTTGHTINTIHFTKENSKGVIFYLHGNGGSLKTVGNVSEHFLPLGLDVFMMDYAGYGKSSDEIANQADFFEDVQYVYDDLKRSYKENQIVVLGYSMGTGLAAQIASTNNPSQLILHAPYYSMVDMKERNYPIIPEFILRYPLRTNEYLKGCKMPISLFHGVNDEVIPLESSQMLSKEFDLPLYELKNQGHLNMAGNKTALQKLNNLLND